MVCHDADDDSWLLNIRKKVFFFYEMMYTKKEKSPTYIPSMTEISIILLWVWCELWGRCMTFFFSEKTNEFSRDSFWATSLELSSLQ
jgi:hypothetical protein